MAVMREMILEAEFSALPDTAQLLIRILGKEATFALISRYGGSSIPVPKAKNVQGLIRYESIAEEIGEEATGKLCSHYGGDILYVPRCAAWWRHERNRRIRADFDRLTINEGWSSNEVAAFLAIDYELSDRRIWEILKEGA